MLSCYPVFCFSRSKSYKVEDTECCKTMNYNMYSRGPSHLVLSPSGGDALALACIWAGTLSHKSRVVWYCFCLVSVSVGSHFLLEQRAVTGNPLLCSLAGQGCDEHLLCAKIPRQGREKGKRRLWAHLPKRNGGCCRQTCRLASGTICAGAHSSSFDSMVSYHDCFPEHCMTWFQYCKYNLNIFISFALCLTQPLGTLLWSNVLQFVENYPVYFWFSAWLWHLEPTSHGGFVGFSPCPSLPPMKLCAEYSISKNKC